MKLKKTVISLTLSFFSSVLVAQTVDSTFEKFINAFALEQDSTTQYTSWDKMMITPYKWEKSSSNSEYNPIKTIADSTVSENVYVKIQLEGDPQNVKLFSFQTSWNKFDGRQADLTSSLETMGAKLTPLLSCRNQYISGDATIYQVNFPNKKPLYLLSEFFGAGADCGSDPQDNDGAIFTYSLKDLERVNSQEELKRIYDSCEP